MRPPCLFAAMPESPLPPEEPKPKRGGWLGAGMMILFLVTLLGLLSLVALPAVLIVVALLVVIGLNYLIWGKWLGAALRREAEEEQEQA